mgnify:CR=1 FL=1
MATKELKELVAFGLNCGELIAGLADGVGFDDIGKVVAVAKLAGSGMGGAAAALAEYAGMTDAEALELEKFVESEFDIANDKVELGIELALKTVIQLHEVVKLFLPKS